MMADNKSSQKLTRKLKFGMIGGGRDAFIGAVHRRAAIADGQTEFVAGALSGSPEKARLSGRDLLLAVDRTYDTWPEMLEKESALPVGERIDFVSIVTPNHLHFEPALAFTQAGFNVVLDKPMVHTVEQAQTLIDAVERDQTVFGITYTYNGYPMVKEARHWVQSGKLGQIRRVVVEYPQGWLAEKIEDQNHKQAEWRTDPARSGPAGALGDIGTHCENLLSYITGLKIEALAADVTAFVSGRRLDDDLSVLLRLQGGAKGILWVSQVAAGEENQLTIRIYGTQGNLMWNQEKPDYLRFSPLDGPAQILSRGNDYLSEAARRAAQLPFGHPEGFQDAFSNVYRNIAATIRARLAGVAPTPLELDFPTVYDGARGIKFIEKVIESSHSDQKWLPFD
jgi:predicted dehydrogenase